jgi:hypothetical protein
VRAPDLSNFIQAQFVSVYIRNAEIVHLLLKSVPLGVFCKSAAHRRCIPKSRPRPCPRQLPRFRRSRINDRIRCEITSHNPWMVFPRLSCQLAGESGPEDCFTVFLDEGKLRSSDLALAQITAKWRHSLETFQKFQADCAKAGFDLELGVHLRNLVAFATGQSRFRTVGTLSVDALQKAWKEAGEGMQFAINFLKSNVAIESPALLSSPFLMVVIAYFGHARGYKISTEESAQLRYWALIANAKGRYSRGSSETLVDQDLASLRDGGAVQDLVDRLRLQVGRLDITPDELEGRNQRSALFKTMFLAFRAADAKDWRSNLTISLDHSGSHHRPQFHHIFPKAQLKSGFTSREADDIANMAFIGGKTNRAISDKSPAIPPLVTQHGAQVFAAQAIPLEADLLAVPNYKAFLGQRRKLIATRLNEFLAAKAPIRGY